MKSLIPLIFLLISFHAQSQSIYPCGVAGCIARWNFANSGTISTLPDVSGNGHTGTPFSLTTSLGFRDSVNKAVHFDGTSSYALVPHNSQLNAQKLTIIALVRLDTFYSGNCQETQIISKGYPYFIPGSFQMDIGDNIYDGSCSVYSPGHQQLDVSFHDISYSEPPSAAPIQLHQWYFLATTYDGDTLKKYNVFMDTSFYVSSISPSFMTSGFARALDSNTMDIVIGHHLNPPFPYWFHGDMDELILFNRILSNSEIHAIYTYLWGYKPLFFIHGGSQSREVCGSSIIPLDSMLQVMDTTSGLSVNWSLAIPPSHGTAAVAYTTTSTGGLLTPSGLSYTPAPGYIGTDMFKVDITDGTTTTSTTITVTADPLPTAGTISGTDTVCPGDTVHLTETVPGGTWGTSYGSIAIIDGAGIVTGMAPGHDSVIYVVMNACGTAATVFPFWVSSSPDCHTHAPVIASGNESVLVYPNPNSGTFRVASFSSAGSDTRFVITNIMGAKIMEFMLPPNRTKEIAIDAPGGMYFLSASGERIHEVTKIVINR